jgi:hypothetical protein
MASIEPRGFRADLRAPSRGRNSSASQFLLIVAIRKIKTCKDKTFFTIDLSNYWNAVEPLWFWRGCERGFLAKAKNKLEKHPEREINTCKEGT